MSDNTDEKGRFKKGKSGNPNGRPKGKTGKWSDAKLADELAKGCKGALDVITKLMNDDRQNGATRLRAAIAWLDKDKAMRDTLYKHLQDRLKAEREGNPSVHEAEEDDTPIVSLKSIEGGKSQ